MRRLITGFLLLVPLLCFGQGKRAPDKAIAVKVEATQYDKKLLLDKLNENGSGQHIRFNATDPDQDYAYRIVFSAGQEVYPTYYGGVNASTATADVFDSKGTELFQIKRAGRGTDKGATNAVAKEILKRILKFQ